MNNQYDEQQIKVCPRCQMTLGDIQENGVVGCSTCYEVFKQDLLPIIEELQGSLDNVGKNPFTLRTTKTNFEEIERLKEEIDIAVSEHRFIDAAALDKRLKFLEGGENG